MTMTTSDGNSNCLVCSGPSNGICHFGVQCCRACASFFHRSIKERRNYTCRWDQNCRISNDHGLRNSCRACRLKKCLEMGMAEEKKRERKVVAAKTFTLPTQMQQEQFQNGFISLGSLQNSLPNTSLIINKVFERQNSFSIPLTLQMDDSIRQYDNGLRAFSIVEGISTELADTKEVRLITQQELSRADRATALLIYAMICQQLPILRELSVNYRIKMLKEFCKQFVTFHRIFMTTQTFSDNTSPYVFIVPGGAIDRNMLAEFFAENQNEEEKEKINISMMERLIEFGKGRVCPLKVSHLEFAALTGIVFWNTVEKHLMPIIPFDQVRAQKDAFYGELFSIISNNYGSLPHQSVIRHSNLLEILHQLNLLISDVYEMQIMAKIFTNLPDFWDDLNLPPDQHYIQIDDSVKQMDNSV